MNEAQPTLQITLTPILSRSTGRGGQRGNGFTTIELLVAVFVLGVIATTLVPYVMKLREVDRRNRCAFNLNLIRDALHRYAADNKFQYPRVIYDGKNEPNTYTCFSGPDAADPFAAGDAVKPNDVTASIWLLLRDGNLTDPAIFICPSSEDHRESITDPAGRPVKITQRSNFRSGEGLSYGYSTPFSAAIGYKMNDTRRSDFAILGDKAPPLANAGALSGPGSQSPPLQFELLNSRNHAGAGQNVLFADDSVLFERTPYCGVGRSQTTAGDNIYTALAAKPLKGETPPADGIGLWGHDIGPAWESDSYLVPREGESAR